jgi:hypothetical protein
MGIEMPNECIDHAISLRAKSGNKVAAIGDGKCPNSFIGAVFRACSRCWIGGVA